MEWRSIKQRINNILFKNSNIDYIASGNSKKEKKKRGKINKYHSRQKKKIKKNLFSINEDIFSS